MTATSTSNPISGLAIHLRPFTLALLLTLLFFLSSAPTLSLLTRWRGDERYYTDAALRMHQTAEYLTPYDAEGTTRFNKPVLNYWLITGSYKLLGVSPFSARVAQLLFGSLALLAAYRLALVLFEDHDVALLTLAAMAMNEPCLNASIRSTTDIVQHCLLTSSLAGFAALLFRRDRLTWSDYLLAFGALGLAALTKGGMAIILLLYITAFTLYLRRRDPSSTQPAKRHPPFRRVLPWHGILLALAPLVIWLSLSMRQHGTEAAREFWFDQVSRRIEGSGSFLLTNLVAYGTGPLVALFPFFILLALAAWNRLPDLRDLVQSRRAEITFAVAWFVLVFVVVTPANITRTRYLLPTYPMLAATLAYLLVHLSRRSATAARTTSIAAEVVAFLTCLYGLALAAFATRLPTTPVLAGLSLAAGAGILWLAFLRRRLRGHASVLRWVPAALLIVAAYRLTDVSIRSRLFSIVAPEALRQIHSHFPTSTPSVATLGLDDEAAHLRLLSAGKLPVTNLPADADPTAAALHAAILLPASSTLTLPGYTRIDAGLRCDRWKVQDYTRVALGKATLQDIFALRGRPAQLLVRDVSRRPTPPPPP